MNLASEMRARAVALWHLQRIRKLVRAQLGTQALVSVVELPCPDPGCPGPATQITIMGFDLARRVVVLHRSASEITGADINTILPDMMSIDSTCHRNVVR